MLIPACTHLRSEACSGLDKVMEDSGRKRGGWYEIIIEEFFESASRKTDGVRLETKDIDKRFYA